MSENNLDFPRPLIYGESGLFITLSSEKMDEFYRNLVCALPDIVYQIDVDGRFTYLNDSVRSLGYTPKELMGQHFGTVVEAGSNPTVNIMVYLSQSESRQDDLQHKFFNERRTGRRITKKLQVRLKCKQSYLARTVEYREGEVFATGLYEPESRGGRFLGTVGVIRESPGFGFDEKSAERVEKYYRLLMENSMELIAVIAHDGTILYISKSSTRNLGFNPFDLIGENIMDFIHGEDAYHLTNIFSERVDYGSDIREMDFRLRNADGRWLYFETTIMPVMDLNRAHTMCFIMHGSDITKRKELEFSTAKRERIYRMLLQTSPDAIVLIDRDGDLILINEQGRILLGGTRDELIGMKYSSFIADEDKERIAGLVSGDAREETSKEIQFTLKGLHGKSLPVEASFAMLNDEQGLLEGHLAVFRDITRRKKFEEERKRLEEELLSVIIGRLSDREIELLKMITEGFRWPDQKREIGKKMDALPGTLDQFVNRIKKKMGMTDIEKIASIAALYFNWEENG